jgi:antirestriction protein ArdC
MKKSIQEMFAEHAEKCASLPNMAGKQINAVSGREYQGMNRISLYLGAKENDWTNEWYTHEQFTEKGYTLRKDEHGTPVFNFKLIEKEGSKEKQLRYYLVFNASQLQAAEEAAS